ncbi:MAG: hypothetical protein U0736_13225 [Gemmataceae bacterium]
MLDNPVLLDRRLGELAAPSRQLLALLGVSRQPWWALGNLVELVMALGHLDGLAGARSAGGGAGVPCPDRA